MRSVTTSTGYFADTLSALAPLGTLSRQLADEVKNLGSELSCDVWEQFSSKHVVFVDGIMNELAAIVGNYFCDNIEEIERWGATTSHLRFPSSAAIEKNADALFQAIKEVHHKQKRPLTLVGHSKGGAEVLFAVLRHPELIFDKIVEKVILIEPAIGGSMLADCIKDNWFGRLVKWWLSDGLVSLSTKIAKKKFDEVYSHFLTLLKQRFASLGQARVEEEWEKISRRIYYVRGQHPEEQTLSLGLRIVLYFCQKKLDPSLEHDGLLTLESQILNTSPQFGTVLEDLKADHMELVIGGWFSRSTKKIRAAFTRALFHTVYSEQ